MTTCGRIQHTGSVTLAVVGVGLLGGSVAAALRKQGVVTRILGVGRHPETLDAACQLGLIDNATSLEDATQQADVIVLAVPVGAMPNILQRMRPHLPSHTLVTDVGSTKADVVAAVLTDLSDRAGQFVPGHPIAGAETSGPQAANAHLFEARTVVLTPLAQNSAAVRQQAAQLWERMGARVVWMTPESHDAVLAGVSHFPHLLSAAYMTQVLAADDADVRLAMAGSGFRDITRIAAASPEMWRDIFLANRQAVLAELQRFKSQLDRVEQLLTQSDGAGLEHFLQIAADARRAWQEKSA